MAVQENIYRLFLNRKNYTWEVDEATEQNIKAAIEEAEAKIRSWVGNPTLDLTTPEYRGLLIDCAWYIINDKLADFESDYLGEIAPSRLVEGFGCG